MRIFVETDRLIMREVVPDDAAGFFRLDADPEVHRYLGNKPVKTIEECEIVIAFIRQQYKENGIGRWAVIEKNSHAFIGWAGLKLITETINNHHHFYDIGYRLIRHYWGKGYGTECALASVRYGFEQIKTDNLFAMAYINNIASNKILLKCGFQLTDVIERDGAKQNWYEINRDQWQNKLNKQI